MSLLSVKGLSVKNRRTNEILVRNVEFELTANTCLGIVGESGSGKTLACTSMLGLSSPWLTVNGEVWFDNNNLLTVSSRTLRRFRGDRICMILQNPMTAFDPLYPLGRQVLEVLSQKKKISRKMIKSIIINALERVQIREPEATLLRYPHQVSGGMLQRCMIALTLALEPDLIIADEPTTALDTINQQEVIKNFVELQRTTGTAMIFISHDLGAVRQIAQDILVMQNGCQVEYGPANKIFNEPCHSYTKYLINAHTSLTSSFRQAMQVSQERVSC